MTRALIPRLVALVVLIVVIGTVFFHHVEGWTWLDAYFFTVVTLSTVGYGSLVPVTALGKVATTVLIFLGLAVVAVAIQQLGHFALLSRAQTREKLREARARAKEAEKRAEAAEERGPDA